MFDVHGNVQDHHQLKLKHFHNAELAPFILRRRLAHALKSAGQPTPCEWHDHFLGEKPPNRDKLRVERVSIWMLISLLP
jgi:hypothetical protein